MPARALALTSYFGGKTATAGWVASRFERGVGTWVEAFGGGLSPFLAAIVHHRPATAVVAERIPALRRAYLMVRDNPEQFSMKYRALLRTVKTWDDLKLFSNEPEDGDPVRWVLGCECSFASNKGHGLSYNSARRMVQRDHTDRDRAFKKISFVLRLPKKLVVVDDFREALNFSGATFADPPYLGTGGYADAWSKADDEELAAMLQVRQQPTLVSTYSLNLYPPPTWERMVPEVVVRNSVAAANGLAGRTLDKEGYFWRRP